MSLSTQMPELGDLVRVQAAAGLKVRDPNGVGDYSETEPTEVRVTPHIYQLLRDGDLIVVLD